MPRFRPNRLVTLPRLTPKRHPLLRALLALAPLPVVVAVCLARAAPSHDELCPVLLIACVAVAAVAGGLLPAVIASAIAVVVLLRVHGGAPGELGRFITECVMISVLGGWLNFSRHRAKAFDAARALLEKEMLEIGDRERTRFGHDLHDGLGQQLTGIALISESLAHELDRRQLPQAQQAQAISKMVSESIGWTRELARGLSPLTLDSEGLSSALEELTSRAGKIFSIQCTYESSDEKLPVEPSSAIHLYRVVQEAISNSVKHGKAKNVQVRAAVAKGSVSIVVSDDGSGLSAETVAHPGLGLRIMQYRANLIGAQLTVARAAQHGGTVVSCVVPAASRTSEDS